MAVDADTDAAINLCAMYGYRRLMGVQRHARRWTARSGRPYSTGWRARVAAAARIGKNRRGRRPGVSHVGRRRSRAGVGPPVSLTGRLAAAAPMARLRNGAMVSGMVRYQRSARTTSLPENLGCDALFSLRPELP
jgi:hypothetical protein